MLLVQLGTGQFEVLDDKRRRGGGLRNLAEELVSAMLAFGRTERVDLQSLSGERSRRFKGSLDKKVYSQRSEA